MRRATDNEKLVEEASPKRSMKMPQATREAAKMDKQKNRKHILFGCRLSALAQCCEQTRKASGLEYLSGKSAEVGDTHC